MSQYGKFCEITYRQNFKKPIEWLKFNIPLLPDKFEDHLRAIAIDPSYISKSGKKTPGLAYFWPGCASAVKKGLEILGFAYVDVNLDEGYFLKAEQTFKDKKFKGIIPKYLKGLKKCDSLIVWYLRMIEKNSALLKSISNIIVADAHFSKETFMTGLKIIGFDLISRFRDDVRLKYLYTGEQHPGKGRPKKYDEDIDMNDLREDVFTTEVVKDRGEKNRRPFSNRLGCQSEKGSQGRNSRLHESGQEDPKQKSLFLYESGIERRRHPQTVQSKIQDRVCLQGRKGVHRSYSLPVKNRRIPGFRIQHVRYRSQHRKKRAKDNGMYISVGPVKCILKNAAMVERIISMFGKSPNMKINSTDFKELLLLGVRSTLKGQNLDDFSRSAS